jgi:hypothetical protein
MKSKIGRLLQMGLFFIFLLPSLARANSTLRYQGYEENHDEAFCGILIYLDNDYRMIGTQAQVMRDDGRLVWTPILTRENADWDVDKNDAGNVTEFEAKSIEKAPGSDSKARYKIKAWNILKSDFKTKVSVAGVNDPGKSNYENRVCHRLTRY